MSFICKWQMESSEEDGKLHCTAYPEHPECKSRAQDIISERVLGKMDYYMENCSHFTPVDGIERLI